MDSATLGETGIYDQPGHPARLSEYRAFDPEACDPPWMMR
jgi:hypothetical protein